MAKPRASNSGAAGIGRGGTGDVVAIGDTRARIAAAAFELFGAQGYDGTTIDAIAERAGIARRTFFRYFRSKDDVIFPDHESLLETVARHFDAAGDAAPVETVCGAVRIVFRSYVADPEVSFQRYRLSRSVTPLREREIASVQAYERAFSAYLRTRLAPRFPEHEATLYADVVAAAVVAAHNTVLRDWLRAGGQGRPLPLLDDALAFVDRTLAPVLVHGGLTAAVPPARPAGAAVTVLPGAMLPGAVLDPEQDAGTVVAVFRSPAAFDEVVHGLRRQLEAPETD